MDSLPLTGSPYLHLVVAACAGAACLAACRWSGRVWPAFGLVIALGFLFRASVGLALFGISYFDLPILEGLHSGDGFWRLAPDAKGYSRLAVEVAAGSPLPADAPSPSFVTVLALWFRVAGPGPASALLLNLVLYVALSVVLVAAFRHVRDFNGRHAALVTLGAFSFSPVLIFVATQPLKDAFFAFLVVAGFAALAWLLAALRRPELPLAAWALPLAALASAIHQLSGVRPYYGVLTCGAAGLGLVARLVALKGGSMRHVAAVAVALTLLTAAFAAGAGVYIGSYASLAAQAAGVTSRAAATPAADAGVPATTGVGAVLQRFAALRAGFVRAGGDTNLVDREAAAEEGPLRTVLLGLAAVFVPISALQQLSLVEFSGGQGFLLLTDLDTLFMNAALGGALWIVLASRRQRRLDGAFVAATLALGCVSALLLGYIVTNYGTLFRLRLLALMPVWLLPLALAACRADDGSDGRGRGERSRLPSAICPDRPVSEGDMWEPRQDGAPLEA